MCLGIKLRFMNGKIIGKTETTKYLWSGLKENSNSYGDLLDIKGISSLLIKYEK